MNRFIGRKTQTRQICGFLKPGSPHWLLNVFGLPGVGKTTLLRHLVRILTKTSYPPTIIDLEKVKEFDDILKILGDNLLARGLPDQVQTEYRQAVKENEEWKRNQQIIINQKIEAYNSHIHDVNQRVSGIYSDVKLEAARQGADIWRSLIRHLDSHTDPIVIFFDHWDYLANRLAYEPNFEDTDESSLKFQWRSLRDWIVKDILLKTQAEGDFPPLRVIIFSYQSLKEYDLKEGVTQLELPGLIDEEVRRWLQREGMRDNKVEDAIVQYTHGNPLLISFALTAWQQNPNLNLAALIDVVDTHAATEWFIHDLIQNLPEPSRTVLELAIVLRNWRLGDLRGILVDRNLELSDQWWLRFITYPFVMESELGPSVMEFIRLVREVRTSWLWHNTPDEFSRMHAHAAKYYLSQHELNGLGGYNV